MKESALLQFLGRRFAIHDQVNLGIGDDCCEWEPSGRCALSVDSLVEGRHFTSEDDAADVGKKAAAAALSDLAAHGAVPQGAVVALHCPSHWHAPSLMEALATELHAHQCPLLGGDTTGSDLLIISVTVWGGQVSGGRFIHRSYAQPGDGIFVSGPLGGSLHMGRHLRPVPRLSLGQWLAQHPGTGAMMDISDGLAADVPRLAQASEVHACIHLHDIPIHSDVPYVRGDELGSLKHACCDGEDFELLFTMRQEFCDRLLDEWPRDEPEPTCIGLCETGSGVSQALIDGSRQDWPWTGFDHQL